MVILGAVVCAGVLVAAVCTLLAPPLLARARWAIWRPRRALACWHLALAGGLIGLVCPLVCAVVATRISASEGLPGLVLSLAGWCCVFLLGACYALLLGRGEPVVRRELGVSDLLRTAALGCPQREEHRPGVMIRYVDTDEPLAFSFHAPRPTVVIGRRVQQGLPAAELEAIIAHERAHLKGRHQLAVRLATIGVACAPRFAPAQQLQRSTQLLVELIADDAAVARCGRPVVESALAGMAELTGSPELAVRAQRLRAGALSTAAPR